MPISATIPNLPTGSSIDVRVRAFNQAGFGPYSSTQTLSTTPTTPPPPPTGVTQSFTVPVEWRATVVPGQVTGVTATAPTNTTITVGWQTPAGPPPASGYIVQFKRAVDPTYTSAPSWLESINGVTIVPGSGSIIDGASPPNTFTISAGGQVVINGVTDSPTSGVDGGKYWAHQFWQHTSLGWWGYLGTPGSYTTNQADPALSIPASTSFSQVITGLVSGTAYNFRVLAFNAVGNGPVSAVANQSTTSGAVGVQPPPQAAAAGFNTIVLNTDFISMTEVTDFDSGLAAPWFTGSCNEGRLLGPSDWSISNSILSIFNGSGPASGITTTRNNSYLISRPSARITTPNADGLAYQYGHFEAKMRFGPGRSGPGWPSWWGTPPHNQTGAHLELDFMEANPQQSDGFWNWFNGTQGGGLTEAFVAGGADGYPGYDFSPSIAASGLDTTGGWNIYGCTWTTTRVTFWWNSAARRDAGIADTIVGDYPTTTLINGQTNQGRFGAWTLNGGNNGNGMMLIMGGCTTANVQFDWIRAWQ